MRLVAAACWLQLLLLPSPAVGFLQSRSVAASSSSLLAQQQQGLPAAGDYTAGVLNEYHSLCQEAEVQAAKALEQQKAEILNQILAREHQQNAREIQELEAQKDAEILRLKQQILQAQEQQQRQPAGTNVVANSLSKLFNQPQTTWSRSAPTTNYSPATTTSPAPEPSDAASPAASVSHTPPRLPGQLTPMEQKFLDEQEPRRALVRQRMEENRLAPKQRLAGRLTPMEQKFLKEQEPRRALVRQRMEENRLVAEREQAVAAAARSYALRNARLVREKAAGKSRWGDMETLRADLLTNSNVRTLRYDNNNAGPFMDDIMPATAENLAEVQSRPLEDVIKAADLGRSNNTPYGSTLEQRVKNGFQNPPDREVEDPLHRYEEFFGPRHPPMAREEELEEQNLSPPGAEVSISIAPYDSVAREAYSELTNQRNGEFDERAYQEFKTQQYEDLWFDYTPTLPPKQDVYALRNARLVREKAAGKSRWGDMETLRADLLTNSNVRTLRYDNNNAGPFMDDIMPATAENLAEVQSRPLEDVIKAADLGRSNDTPYGSTLEQRVKNGFQNPPDREVEDPLHRYEEFFGPRPHAEGGQQEAKSTTTEIRAIFAANMEEENRLVATRQNEQEPAVMATEVEATFQQEKEDIPELIQSMEGEPTTAGEDEDPSIAAEASRGAAALANRPVAFMAPDTPLALSSPYGSIEPMLPL